jgi:hypothetical protein
VNDFHRDNGQQKVLRNKFLLPHFEKTFVARGGGYLLLDDGRFSKMEQERGIDTIGWTKDHPPLTIEEKIVNWKGRVYDSICIETETCTVPGFVRAGWAWYSIADRLLYCMETETGDLDCLWIDFPKLHQWFWPIEKDFNLSVMPDKNMTACRLVPITRIMESVPMKRFVLTAEVRAAA